LQSFVLFTLSAALPSLRPPHCPTPSTTCQQGIVGQLAVLYAAMFLLAIGTGGARFNIATMGADQFSTSRDQDTFFNWYFMFLYASFMAGDTVVVYIQDSVSWTLGFGVCLAATMFSLVMLLLGARYFRMPPPKGSPYSQLARVVVAAVRKCRVDVSALGHEKYYMGDDVVAESASDKAPSQILRFVLPSIHISFADCGCRRSGELVLGCRMLWMMSVCDPVFR
jgi:peptide/histidine transporter 3/4